MCTLRTTQHMLASNESRLQSEAHTEAYDTHLAHCCGTETVIHACKSVARPQLFDAVRGAAIARLTRVLRLHANLDHFYTKSARRVCLNTNGGGTHRQVMR